MAKYGNGEDTPAGGADSATNIYNSVQSANSSSNQPQSDAALNLADFALGQDFAEHAAQKIIVSVPVRRPDRKVFFRTHPDPSYRYATRVLEIPGERDAYLVHPRLQSIVAEAVPVLIITCIDRSGNVFFWPIKLPRNDMMSTSWSDSALTGADLAKTTWIRLVGNRSVNAYEPFPAVANDQLPQPVWPDLTFEQLFNIAFRDRVIQDANHIVLRKLRGEV